MLENMVDVLKYFLDNYCSRYVNILNKSFLNFVDLSIV